ncbi:MAG: DUF5693 family protein [Clostridiales bacterium]|nr:DUF5693 family protein [Clostridiales bacterium]
MSAKGKNANTPISGKLLSGMRWLGVIALAASFVCASWVNFGLRAPVEARDDTVGLLVDYDELKRLADGSQDVTFADMARKAAKAGATGLVVRERILADWESAGDVLVLTGGQLEFYLRSQSAADIGGGPAPEADGTYILTKDPLVYEQIFSMLEAKRRYPLPYECPGYMAIATHLHSSERATLGLGFPLKQLEEAAEEGLQVIARIRNWEPVREDSLAEVFRWTGMIPNLAGVGFNDMSVPGGGANAVLQDHLAAAILPLGKPLISFEFYDQAGLPGLAARLDHHVLRAHAIAENELRKYANVRDALDRYNLAATERNIRYIYLRFYGLENPAASLISNTDLISEVRESLAGEGLRVGDPTAIPDFRISVPLLYIMGLGVIAAGGWLLALGAAPFAGKRLCLPYFALLCAGCLAWAFLLMKAPTLSRKLFALAAAVFFPSLGVALVLKGERPAMADKFRAGQALYALKSYLVMSVFTLIGAMVMSALLAEPAFMLKLDGFVGVKLAHLVPLVLAPCVLWLREEGRFGLMSGTVRGNVRFWQLAAGLVMLAGLAIYILRTGNESLGTVSELEMRIRQILDRILGVRPRTKEFLIGHPAMLILLYFGCRFKMLPVLMVGMIGQVSLINTYAHIHTPVRVSLIRSFHGLWIGAVLGLAAIAVIIWLARLARRVGAGEGEEEGGGARGFS